MHHTSPLALLPSVLVVSLLGTPNVPAPQPLARTQDPGLVITGATLIDGTGAPPRTGTTIIARDGRIAAVGPDGRIDRPKGANVIDAAGKYVIPGLAVAKRRNTVCQSSRT